MTQYWDLRAQLDWPSEPEVQAEREARNNAGIAEVMSILGDLQGLDVLELGAGWGDYTGLLVTAGAKSVMAIDFIQSYLDTNKRLNGHHGNVTFQQADVTNLKLLAESFDLVFANGLLMYLNDQELHRLFSNMLSWLRPGGKLFFRESCCHQRGPLPAGIEKNPTIYRDPKDYTSMFQSPTLPLTDSDQYYVFEIILSKSMETYIKFSNNPNVVCWLVQKVRLTNSSYRTLQEYLDTQRYSQEDILHREHLFGCNFLEPGSQQITKELVAGLDLQPGLRVLDAGAGLGGAAYFMIQNFNVNVLEIDISSNVVRIATERARDLKEQRIHFEVGDISKRTFENGSFDVVFSQDTMAYIKDKKGLLEKFMGWLRPGGKLFLSDFCCNEGPQSFEFKSYLAKKCYHLLYLQQYKKILSEVGFNPVKIEDRTQQLVDVLGNELTRVSSDGDTLAQEQGHSAILSDCSQTAHHSRIGDQTWVVFYAEKPLI